MRSPRPIPPAPTKIPEERRRLSRRSFLQASGAAVALGAAGSLVRGPLPSLAAAASRRAPVKGISIQLYTMRELMDIDMEAVFAGLRRIGYRIVEHAGFHGRSAEEFKEALDRHDLWATSGHHTLSYPYVEPQWQEQIDDALVLGQRYIGVAAAPYTFLGFFGDFQAPGAMWADYAATLNRAGEAAREAGLRLGYHNHNAELEPLPEDPDRRPIDILLEETDPDLVHFELDIYWSWAGGQDPAKLLRQYPDRFRQLHVKDMDEDGGITAPGKGVIDFARVFRAGEKTQPVREFIIEQDNAGQDAMRSARLGYRLLRRIRY